jgi:hypothetical protein
MLRGLYRVGSLKTVASELAKYNLHIVAVQMGQEWQSASRRLYIFSMEMGMLIITKGQDFSYIR